jgi:hypothetical protein
VGVVLGAFLVLSGRPFDGGKVILLAALFVILGGIAAK